MDVFCFFGVHVLKPERLQKIPVFITSYLSVWFQKQYTIVTVVTGELDIMATFWLSARALEWVPRFLPCSVMADLLNTKHKRYFSQEGNCWKKEGSKGGNRRKRRRGGS